MTIDKMYLWVNLSDITEVGIIYPLGSPLFVMVRPSLGDKLLTYLAYKSGGAVDRIYFVIRCTEERALAIRDGIELIGRHKLGRKVRTRLTKREPGKSWERRALQH